MVFCAALTILRALSATADAILSAALTKLLLSEGVADTALLVDADTGGRGMFAVAISLAFSGADTIAVVVVVDADVALAAVVSTYCTI